MVFFDEAPESPPLFACGQRGSRDIAMMCAKQIHYVLLFEAGNRLGLTLLESLAGVARDVLMWKSKVLRVDHAGFGQRHDLLHHVLELTNVARPIVFPQSLHRLRRELPLGTAVFFGV